MAFHVYDSLDAHGGPVLVTAVLANSITVTQLDSVKYASGFVALGTAGASVLGHVADIVTDKGVGVNSTGVAGAEVGSFVGSFLTASNNQTVGLVSAVVDVSQQTRYSAEVDVAIATTTGSNLPGYRMDLVDANTLDEDTAATTTAQYATWGVDPSNSARALVNIFESQIFNT